MRANRENLEQYSKPAPSFFAESLRMNVRVMRLIRACGQRQTAGAKEPNGRPRTPNVNL
jgi:hypothetical protein